MTKADIKERMCQLADKLSSPIPWRRLKALPSICEKMQIVREETLREFAKSDPMPELQIPNPKYSPKRKGMQLETIPNPEVYKRLDRIKAALEKNPELAALRRAEEEAKAIADEFLELEGLVRQYARRLLKLYPKYFEYATSDPDKQARAMRTLFSALPTKATSKTSLKKRGAGRPKNPPKIVAFVQELKEKGWQPKDIAQKANEKYPRLNNPWTPDAVRKMGEPAKKKNSFRHIPPQKP
jgi:hypothetical protein